MTNASNPFDFIIVFDEECIVLAYSRELLKLVNYSVECLAIVWHIEVPSGLRICTKKDVTFPHNILQDEGVIGCKYPFLAHSESYHINFDSRESVGVIVFRYDCISLLNPRVPSLLMVYLIGNLFECYLARVLALCYSFPELGVQLAEELIVRVITYMKYAIQSADQPRQMQRTQAYGRKCINKEDGKINIGNTRTYLDVSTPFLRQHLSD